MPAADRIHPSELPQEPHLPTVHTARRSRSEVPDAVDVAVIGAGPAGLSAGAYLAQSGASVAIFDPHYLAGGCCTMFARGKRSDRYLFDIGMHYLGDYKKGGIFDRMLGPLGVEIPWQPMDEDGFDTLVYPEGRLAIPASLEGFRERLVEQFPRERRGIDRYIRFLREVDGMLATMNAKGFGLNFAIHMLMRGRLVGRFQGGTLATLLDSCTRDPLLRAYMCGPHGDYGLPPSKVSALLHAALLNHYLAGAAYPKGGGQAFAEAIAAKVEQAGGGIYLQRKVTRLLTEDGAAVGVRIEDRKGATQDVRARAVVSGMDLERLLLDVVPAEDLPSEWKTQAQTWTYPNAIFLTCLAVKDDLGERGFGTTNYWVHESTDIEDVYSAAEIDDEPRIQAAYITSATRKDPHTPHHAPPGVETVEVMTLVPGTPKAWGVSPESVLNGEYRHMPEYERRKQRMEDILVGKLEGLFPGVGQHIVFRESASPVTHARYTGAMSGSGYGIACTPDQFGLKRPGFRGPLPSLYLSGASTRSGHGIAGALASGQGAAQKVARDLGLTLPGPRTLIG